MELERHGPFVATVAELAQRHRLDVRVRLTRLNPGACSPDPHTVLVSRELLAAPAEVQRHAAAHEMAHIVLGHHAILRRSNVRAAGLLGCGMVGAVVTGGLGGLFAVTGAALVAGRNRDHDVRPLEVAADRQAEEWGHPLDEAGAAYLQRLERWSGRLPEWARTHPRPQRRITGA